MNSPYRLEVKLWIRGPLITSGGGNSLRGVDRMFNRSATGELVFQGSHIKGKLREALEDLPGYGSQLNAWFGRPSGNASYFPNRGSLIFDDFFLEQAEAQNPECTAVRISIDPQTGTSREHQLFTTEMQFPSGGLTVWKGSIRFWEANHSAANRTSEEITLGLKWMNTIGGIKGSGYGRLEKVSTKLEACKVFPQRSGITSVSRKFRLQIETENDLFIGGVVNSTNYLESRQIIPGAVLKGSFAKFLNEMCGEKFGNAIDANNQKVAAAFPDLVKNFWAIRFTHAFPAPPFTEKRPVKVPFSTVSFSDDKYLDIAFCKDALLDNRNRPPQFAIDWKNPEKLNEKFGWAHCHTINKTRTQIHKPTRTAEENKLYTFRYISPYKGDSDAKPCSNRPKVYWISNITLPEDSGELPNEFYRAIHSGWERLGKRNSRFHFDLQENHAEPALIQHDAGVLVEGRAIVNLQTDAFMFDPYAQTNLDNLHALYTEYWDYATGGTCRMSHFFARQSFSGGYTASMYRLHANNHYFPYLLTAAGSVFVLEPVKGKEGQARTALEKLRDRGLPLPKSIITKMNDKNIFTETAWSVCPFVPENGFGEIFINLKWHWENRLISNDQ